MTSKKRVAGDAALVFAGILFALLIDEIFLRVSPFGQKYFYVYHSYLGWTLKPGAHGWQAGEGNVWLRVNRWGYRGGDWPLKKSPRTFRIAVLGDSFTEAEQVTEDKTFCTVTERQLASCPVFHAQQSRFERVEVLNFGCDSYGTAQELITLKRWVWEFAPDMVVLAIFTGNDIRNNSVVLEGVKCRPFYIVRDGALTLGGPFEDSFWFRMECMMRFESRHIQVLNAARGARSAIRALLRSRRRRAAKATSLVEPGIDDLVYRPPSDRTWSEAWDITEREVSEIHRECVSRGVPLLAITLSNPAQDNPDAGQRAAYAKWLGVANLDYPDSRIQQLGEREGFDVLSLAKPMREYAETHHVELHGSKNTEPGSGHWNGLGHQVAGKLIASQICATIAHEAAKQIRISR